MGSPKLNEYARASHARTYLARADQIPHRTEGEAVVLELLPPKGRAHLGTGRRRRAATRAGRAGSTPDAQGVALDFSAPMLAAARERFAQDSAVTVVDHNLNAPLPEMGGFDVVLSSFAIHHLDDVLEFVLYQEVFVTLEPGGLFCNLEHVSSPSSGAACRPFTGRWV